MTHEAYIRATKISSAIDKLDNAIEYLEEGNSLNCIRFTRAMGPELKMDLFLLSDEDIKRITKRLLTAFKDERDLLKAEYEEL